jgi:hypothetical protein
MKYTSSVRAFAPTMSPTEGLLPTFNAPQPTFYPTLSFSIPDISLTFNVKQTVYIRNPPTHVTNVTILVVNTVSSLVGINKSDIHDFNMTSSRPFNAQPFIVRASHRSLLNFYISYNITTSPIELHQPSVNAAYRQIIDILSESVGNSKFTYYIRDFAHKLDMVDPIIETTSIYFSNYSVISRPPSSTNITSSGQSLSSINLYIVDTIVICGLLLMLSCALFANKWSTRKPVEKCQDMSEYPTLSPIGYNRTNAIDAPPPSISH